MFDGLTSLVEVTGSPLALNSQFPLGQSKKFFTEDFQRITGNLGKLVFLFPSIIGTPALEKPPTASKANRCSKQCDKDVSHNAHPPAFFKYRMRNW